MMDFATVIGATVAGEPLTPLSNAWWLGFGEHWFNGVFLYPMLYAVWRNHVGPSARWRRGLAWGVVLFGWIQFFVAPLLDLGIFSTRSFDPPIFLLLSGVGLCAYGEILAVLADPPARDPAPRCQQPEVPVSLDASATRSAA
jgi:hypothetical protein